MKQKFRRSLSLALAFALIIGISVFQSTTTVAAQSVDTYWNEIRVDSIGLSQYNITMSEGDIVALESSISPADATISELIWNSSDESVAVIDKDRNVIAVNSGVATITVTTVESDQIAYFEVTVMAAIEPVSGMEIISSYSEISEAEGNIAIEPMWLSPLVPIGNHSAFRVSLFSLPFVFLGAIRFYSEVFIPGIGWVQTTFRGIFNNTTQATERQRNHEMRNRVMNRIAHYEAHWPTLSNARRQETLVNLLKEAEEMLGIPRINIAFINYSNAGLLQLIIGNNRVLGGYINGIRTILINQGRMDDAHMLHAVFHEARHAYQFEARQCPRRYQISNETLRFWAASYNDTSELSHREYMATPIEWDARHFTGDSHIHDGVPVTPVYNSNW